MKEMEERLARREAIALKLADQLNDKIDECEKRKACEVNLAVQLSAKIDECETLKDDLRWYVERVVTLEKQLHEEA